MTALLAVPLGIALLGGIRPPQKVDIPSLERSECAAPVVVDLEDQTPFIWKAQPGLEWVARSLAARPGLWRSLPGIGSVALSMPTGPIVWVLEDLGCLPGLGLAGEQPDWVAGVASTTGNLIVLQADRAGEDLRVLSAVFRHEVAHLALGSASAGHAPRWLQEGYAQYAAGAWDWQEAWRLRFVLLATGGELLGDLSWSFPREPGEARLAYLLSYTAVHELAALGGDAGLAFLFAQLRDGASLDAAMRRVFGLTEAQFQERWRKRVIRRYGMLYILSRASLFWLTVTLLLLWLGGRRRRRDRQRMQALREAERREAAVQQAGETG